MTINKASLKKRIDTLGKRYVLIQELREVKARLKVIEKLAEEIEQEPQES